MHCSRTDAPLTTETPYFSAWRPSVCMVYHSCDPSVHAGTESPRALEHGDHACIGIMHVPVVSWRRVGKHQAFAVKMEAQTFLTSTHMKLSMSVHRGAERKRLKRKACPRMQARRAHCD